MNREAENEQHRRAPLPFTSCFELDEFLFMSSQGRATKKCSHLRSIAFPHDNCEVLARSRVSKL
jgi:hypothetical protein